LLRTTPSGQTCWTQTSHGSWSRWLLRSSSSWLPHAHQRVSPCTAWTSFLRTPHCMRSSPNDTVEDKEGLLFFMLTGYSERLRWAMLF
jgi:hypothetical protein